MHRTSISTIFEIEKPGEHMFASKIQTNVKYHYQCGQTNAQHKT